MAEDEGEDKHNDDDDDEKDDDRDWAVLPRRVTVKDVLKYSLTWVIIPSFTVHAWTQDIERAWSQPSTRTVDPKAATDWATNSKEEEGDDVEEPVRRLIMNWWAGGPWNHHSRSGARSLCTVSTSRVLKASYSISTTRSFLLGSSSISSELDLDSPSITREKY
ncbi:hypothetical protein Vadar_028337 [Vaccinium darrowii]|uniref:Uncharacterized protein n=1 Tax=Vaccinium darrowii TaxID=229202 RepID=A0ACB7XLU4_9ERIC|nr:hypothetical protein Vadar_028337 [Vaccinium darrowii]